MKILPQILVGASVILSTLPCPAQISVVGSLTDDRFVKAGTRYEGSVTIRNETDSLQEVKVYQTDYSFRFDGTTVYGEPGEDSRSNARWISYTPAFLRLEPRATAEVNYAVAVPDSLSGAPLSGSYWSLLMIEGIGPGSRESAQHNAPDRGGMGISQLIRYGIQIASHIAETGSKAVRFLDVRLEDGPGSSKELVVDILNTGESWFRPAFSAELFDASGNSKGVFKGSTFRMYPETSVRQRLSLGVLPRGKYTVVLMLDAGGEDVFGAEYSLTL
jgi:hypothetical protein